MHANAVALWQRGAVSGGLRRSLSQATEDSHVRALLNDLCTPMLLGRYTHLPLDFSHLWSCRPLQPQLRLSFCAVRPQLLHASQFAIVASSFPQEHVIVATAAQSGWGDRVTRG